MKPCYRFWVGFNGLSKSLYSTPNKYDIEDQLPTWTQSACLHWIWIRIIGDEIVTLATFSVLVLRIWALYERGEWHTNKMPHYSYAHYRITFCYTARWTIVVLVSALLGQIGVAIVSSVYLSMAHTLVCLKKSNSGLSRPSPRPHCFQVG